MESGEMLSGLSMMTLIVVVVIIAVLLLFFLRKRSNRHPMDTPEGREAEEMRRRDAERNRDDDTDIPV